jgi:hypothetical protein
MGIRSNYATDKKAEVEGVEIAVDTNEHNGEPIFVTLCRMGQTNKAYTRALEEATRPHQAAIQAETLDNELGGKILRGVFVDTCLKLAQPSEVGTVRRSEGYGRSAVHA